MRNHAKASPAGSSARGGNRLGRIVSGAIATRGSSGDADGSGAPSHRIARAYGLATLALAIAALLAIFAAPAGASALPEHTPLPELEHTGFEEPCGVATDSAGDYYVADAGAKTITVYDPEGKEITSFAAADFSNGVGPCRLAVDSSGNVYASNRFRSEVLRYVPGGEGFPPKSGTTYALDTSLNGNGALISTFSGITSLGSVAIDPSTQDAYVTAPASSEVQEYTIPAGNYKFAFNGTTGATELTPAASLPEIRTALRAVACGGGACASLANGNPSATRRRIGFAGVLANSDQPAVEIVTGGCTVAVDCEAAREMFRGSPNPHVVSYEEDGTLISDTIGSAVSGANYIGVDVYAKNGNVYAADKAHNKVLVFNNAGDTVLAEFDGSDSLAGAFDFSDENSLPDIAVDQSDGHVYVSDMQAHHVVDEFDGAGNFVSELSHSPAFEEGELGNGIAVDNGASSPGKGRVYLTARTEAGGVAEATRGVFAFGPLIYGLPLKEAKTGRGAGIVKSAPVGIDCGSTCEAEFEAGATVKLRLEADFGSALGAWSGCDAVNVAGECEVAMGEVREVSVRIDSQPVIGEEAANGITASGAELSAKANPEGKATSYYFEYITRAALEANEASSKPPFAGATKAPISPLAIGNGASPVAVAVKVRGLASSTAYRFRVVASNEVGTAEGEYNSGHEEIPRSFVTYSPPQVFTGECPGNEALRTGPAARLPDCRAYEQASPVDKNGGSLQATAPFTRTAEDGSTITFESTTGVPGGAGAQSLPTYMAKRGPSGWSTTGLLPDPSSGQAAQVLGWSASFDTAFDFAERYEGGASMLARGTASGDQTEIVPHTIPAPTYSYVDTSENGETVFEAAPAKPGDPVQLTPNAAAGKPNVYAWDQSEPAKLRLAGVLPDGSTPAQGSRAGRGAGAEEYNWDSHLVSSDGSVFFNDNTDGQLYLRLNPTAEETSVKDHGNCVPDPVLACTVHVSASHKTNGNGPGGTDPVGPQPASFRAASRDGSVATFTSSEKLTDDANTGPEPQAPVIAKAKASDGSGKNLSSISAFAQEIAVDEAEGYVYWSDPAHHRIGRAKLDGTEVNDDYVSLTGEPRGIAVIDSGSNKYIYWTDRGELDQNGEPQSGLGTIGRMDLDGSNVNPSCFTGLTNPRSIAASSTFIYWTEPVASSILGDGSAGRATLACEGSESGTKELELVNRGSGDIAVDATHIYVSTYNPSLHRSFISRFPINGGAADCFVGFFEDVTSPVGVAVNSEKVYWANAASETIGRADLDCSNQQPEFIGGASRAEDPAIAGEDLLWTANQAIPANPGNDLYQFRLDGTGGSLEDLAPGSSVNGTDVVGVLGASEDGSDVYFAANGVPDGVGNSPNANGESAAPGNCSGVGSAASGSCNLFVAHDGEVDFIARLDAEGPGSAEDGGDWVDWIQGRLGLKLKPSDRSARVSAGGEVLVFRSSRQLTGYDNQGPTCVTKPGGEPAPGRCLEFYRFDLANMNVTCLTCDPRGTTPTDPAGLASLRSPNIGAPAPAATLGRNLSRDGDRFFFETDDALVAEDTNGRNGCPKWGTPLQIGHTCQDVYEWEAPGTGSCTPNAPAYSALNEGCIYLISDGTTESPAFFGDADREGNNVFVFTYAKLVPQDDDGLFDAYDVRVDGGLAGQHQSAPVPCEGEACEGQASEAPHGASSASAFFQGPGNQAEERKPNRPCPKGKRRVRHGGKTRCVKVHHGGHRHHRRAANANGRAGR